MSPDRASRGDASLECFVMYNNRCILCTGCVRVHDKVDGIDCQVPIDVRQNRE